MYFGSPTPSIFGEKLPFLTTVHSVYSLAANIHTTRKNHWSKETSIELDKLQSCHELCNSHLFGFQRISVYSNVNVIVFLFIFFSFCAYLFGTAIFTRMFYFCINIDALLELDLWLHRIYVNYMKIVLNENNFQMNSCFGCHTLAVQCACFEMLTIWLLVKSYLNSCLRCLLSTLGSNACRFKPIMLVIKINQTNRMQLFLFKISFTNEIQIFTAVTDRNWMSQVQFN